MRHAISASTRTPTISAPHTSSVFQLLCCSVADVAVNRASPPSMTSSCATARGRSFTDCVLRSDGGISVLNRGYDPGKTKWNESEGKAYFTGEPTTAALKVSFFGPFYGGYNVIKLDDKYQYALVSGPNRDYLWILSRTPTIPDAVKQDYLNTARELGFRVDQLVWVKH